MLSPEDRERVEQLFERAADLAPEGRQEFLERECGANAAVRAELEWLLAGLEGEDRLGQGSFVLPSRVGTTIGPYVLLEKIGEGGMGEVYAAEQREPVHRRVALKLIKPGMDSSQVIARFEAERQALARMSHPNIAQVFDAGTTDAGLPYFVMELVTGAPLDEYCDRHRLPTRERVELFLAICGGVQHAHQKGIIHRDLKPSNLLVMEQDGRAVPKIIDFGVARATTGSLAERTLFTMVGQVVGTLAYMSPEQADPTGGDIDTRSDIYSLGVVLYQLASGLLPFELSSAPDLALSEVWRTLREKEAPTPSSRLRRESGTATAIAPLHGTDERALVRQLSGDLDWICLKALEKEPARRYASVSELEQDLRRHLAHEPVLAGRPGALYRVRKFVRRHRGAVTGGAVVTGIAAAGLWGVVSARLDAEARAVEVFRLSAQQTLDELVAEADGLWPADEDHLERYESWRSRAAALAAELPEFEAQRLELERRSQPVRPGETERVFDDAGDRWWHDQLAKLVDKLRAFEDPGSGLFSAGISPEHGWGVLRRLEFARSIRERTVTGPEVAAGWEAAAARVAANPSYGELQLKPQLGLVPLGRDPDHGLEEFADLQTGSVPSRDENGHLVLSEGMGLVFVLIPGGSFDMGSQGEEADAPNYDPDTLPWMGPVHRVTLAPFLLSKYELTQGQWERLAGSNPTVDGSEESPGLLPVLGVSWRGCIEQCARFGLTLPSEAQWEYAARAGTSSIWWTGDEPESLAGRANVAGVPGSLGKPAPVGSYVSNAFGLHDVTGNVGEWCADTAGSFDGSSPGEPEDNPFRILRGGAFQAPAAQARTAARKLAKADFNGPVAGLRPARPFVR